MSPRLRTPNAACQSLHSDWCDGHCARLFFAEPIHFWFWKHIVIRVECIIHIIWSCGVWDIAGTLKGSRKKWGGQVCAIAYFLRVERGICLGWSGSIFLGGAANHEGELVFKKKKRKRKEDSFHHQLDLWVTLRLEPGKNSEWMCLCYLFLNPAIAYTIFFGTQVGEIQDTEEILRVKSVRNTYACASSYKGGKSSVDHGLNSTTAFIRSATPWAA